ncbi:MAG: tripartite tricarboxylate transporter substrate binding protein [Oscillospiraceae bacterium]|nr:tripartite tricarboxylate transporter substrate binding protein [Oscillospiraceae bacterium]
MKRLIAPLLALCVLLSLCACAGGAERDGYPARDITGVVQWGSGGGTDSLMRPLAALAEEKLGRSVVVQNMTGAAGSVAAQHVHDAAADGYTLLMGAENPALYDVLGISALTYEDFTCVYLLGDETVGVAVAKDSPYHSLRELIDAALAAPETVTLSTTGKGGLPWEVGAFLTDVTGASFRQIPYDSDATAKLAVTGGECDFTVCKVQSGLEDYRAGELRFLCMLATEPVSVMPDVPLITAEYPAFADYLPWGPFYGVFVNKNTDAAVVETLSRAFSEAAPDESYQRLLAGFNVRFLGYTGDEAARYIEAWRENTVSALRRSGAIEE